MNSQDENLRGWLKIATDKLAPPAKERIWSEIQAHYAAAVENHIRDGSDEALANTAALKELGDAEIAAKRFRKQHLTENEIEIIENSLKSAGSPWVIFFGVACFTLVVCIYRFRTKLPHGNEIMIFAAVVCFVYPIVRCLTAKYSHAKYVLRQLLLMDLLMSYAPYSMMLFFCNALFMWILFLPTFAIIAIFMSIKEASRLRLWWKLRNIEDISEEMPPRGRVAS